MSVAYNPIIDKTLLIASDQNLGKFAYMLLSVSGTTASFGGFAYVTGQENMGLTGPRSVVYDSSSQNLIAATTDFDETQGEVFVFSSVTGLTPNTTYYVQDDGTLSTTSSTVTAGKAMSATSINLDYST
jgi:hypothetical protein